MDLNSVLIVGGGIGGLTAAIAIAAQRDIRSRSSSETRHGRSTASGSFSK